MALGQSCDLLLNFLKYYQGPTYTSSTCKFLIVHKIMPLCANQYICNKYLHLEQDFSVCFIIHRFIAKYMCFLLKNYYAIK